MHICARCFFIERDGAAGEGDFYRVYIVGEEFVEHGDAHHVRPLLIAHLLACNGREAYIAYKKGGAAFAAPHIVF